MLGRSKLSTLSTSSSANEFEVNCCSLFQNGSVRSNICQQRRRKGEGKIGPKMNATNMKQLKTLAGWFYAALTHYGCWTNNPEADELLRRGPAVQLLIQYFVEKRLVTITPRWLLNLYGISAEYFLLHLAAARINSSILRGAQHRTYIAVTFEH